MGGERDLPRIIFYGSGSMARALARMAVESGFEVAFYDRDPSRAEEAVREVGGGRLIDLASAYPGSLVIVATPGSEAGSAISGMAKLDRPPLAVSDIATFKLGLINAYEKLPRSTRACSMHPLFGPRARLKEAHWVALVELPGRREDCHWLATIIDRMGLRYFQVDPETHDELVGLTIGTSYTLGVAIAHRAKGLGVSPGLLEKHMGTTYRLLHLLSEAVASDPPHLVEEIIGNSYTRKAIERLIESIERVLRDPAGALEGQVNRGCRDPYGALYEVVEGVIARHC
ncbi:MAG: prephenate dehydrogenase/arogenate dehydrogenase family protein [Desulfurococcales archaeon]|nr:prephenate dehydrogenase/arogenate dehydrogenase family protein [Desulfurococcales archaeon]